jgi:hypothetical protein
MNPPTIVCCAKYPDIFDGFKKAIEFDSPDAPKIVVLDGGLIQIPEDWFWQYGPQPFNAAKSSNLGWKQAGDADLFFCGDDIRFPQADTVKRLQEIAYSDSCLGMLSPKIAGGAQNSQMHPDETKSVSYTDGFIAMMCVYIKRSTINRVGYLDERFDGYGMEDVDYCRRIWAAGLRVGVTPRVTVTHGLDDVGHSTTFRRTHTWDELCHQAEENQRRFDAKTKV